MTNLLRSDKAFQYLIPLLIGLAAIIFFHSVVAIENPHYWQDIVWDEGWFSYVATKGYELSSENYSVQSNVVFSPGWPLLIRIVMNLLNISFPHAR